MTWSWHDLLWLPSQLHPTAHNKKRLNMDLDLFCRCQGVTANTDRKQSHKNLHIKMYYKTFLMLSFYNLKVCVCQGLWCFIIISHVTDNKSFIKLFIMIMFIICIWHGLRGNPLPSLYNTTVFPRLSEVHFLLCLCLKLPAAHWRLSSHGPKVE